MSIDNQKEVTISVLREIIKYVDSEAVVAGGAPRDWLRGCKANDIDLYLRSNISSGTAKFNLIKKLLSDSHTIEKVRIGSHDDLKDYGGLNIQITSIQNVLIDGVLFQFIFIDPSVKNFRETIVNHMDIGINRVSFDSWQFHCTEAYRSDVLNKTLTLYQGCMGASQLKHCITHHLPKMVKYFPDYKLEIL